jgi:uncharacterized protein YcfL
MTRTPLRAALAATLAAGLLAGCGGDDDTPITSSNDQQVPASATASTASLEAFAIGLAPSDTTEPLGLDLVSAFPTSETEEPVAVN